MEPVTKTLQEFFNAAWERSKDPRKAKREQPPGERDNICVYSRQGDLPGCFIGVSLTPELAEHCDWVMPSLSSILSEGMIVLQETGYSLDDQCCVLSHLQNIHDSGLPTEWKRKLREFAKIYNLTIPGE